MDEKFYYKAVWKSGYGELCSAIAGGRLGVKYKVGEFVKPKIKDSKLFVFESLSHALHFKEMWKGVEIWKCKVINPEKAEMICGLIEYGEVKMFWDRTNIKTSIYFAKPMAGTILCDAVMLVERI